MWCLKDRHFPFFIGRLPVELQKHENLWILLLYQQEELHIVLQISISLTKAYGDTVHTLLIRLLLSQ